jgi:hypothetical protein
VRNLGVALLLLVLVGLSAAGLSACGGGDDGPPEIVYPEAINLRGEVILSGATNVRGGLSECVGAGAYADLFPGAPVVVNNEQGRPLTVGKITYGVGTNFYLNQLDQCTFKVELGRVPRADTFQLVISRQDPVAIPFLSLWRRRGEFSFNFPRPTTTTTTTTTAPAA